jgi:hypothetical protein
VDEEPKGSFVISRTRPRRSFRRVSNGPIGLRPRCRRMSGGPQARSALHHIQAFENICIVAQPSASNQPCRARQLGPGLRAVSHDVLSRLHLLCGCAGAGDLTKSGMRNDGLAEGAGHSAGSVVELAVRGHVKVLAGRDSYMTAGGWTRRRYQARAVAVAVTTDSQSSDDRRRRDRTESRMSHEPTVGFTYSLYRLTVYRATINRLSSIRRRFGAGQALPDNTRTLDKEPVRIRKGTPLRCGIYGESV